MTPHPTYSPHELAAGSDVEGRRLYSMVNGSITLRRLIPKERGKAARRRDKVARRAAREHNARLEERREARQARVDVEAIG